MIKLALVGKDIQHSRSGEIYRRLLKTDIQYDLLDYENSALIPSAADLFKVYDGISITSPYKKHFLNQVQLTAQASSLGAINCLRKEAQGFTGENTDYLAIVEILHKLKVKYLDLSVILLGDGVMSKVAQVALEQLGIEYKIFSRKITEDLNRLNLTAHFAQAFKAPKQKLVLNSCAREFVFSGLIDQQTIFWDFNYNFIPHSSTLATKCQSYIDGIEMLELQAAYALSFWSITPSI